MNERPPPSQLSAAYCDIRRFEMRLMMNMRSKSGMELVQVAILVAIAIALGLIFKTQITDFVNRTFEGLKDFS